MDHIEIEDEPSVTEILVTKRRNRAEPDMGTAEVLQKKIGAEELTTKPNNGKAKFWKCLTEFMKNHPVIQWSLLSSARNVQKFIAT